jgi:hypothetical protein
MRLVQNPGQVTLAMLWLGKYTHQVSVRPTWQWIVSQAFEGSDQAVHRPVSRMEQITDTATCDKSMADHLERSGIRRTSLNVQIPEVCRHCLWCDPIERSEHQEHGLATQRTR